MVMDGWKIGAMPEVARMLWLATTTHPIKVIVAEFEWLIILG